MWYSGCESVVLHVFHELFTIANELLRYSFGCDPTYHHFYSNNISFMRNTENLVSQELTKFGFALANVLF